MTEEEQAREALALAAETTEENLGENVARASALSPVAWALWAYSIRKKLGVHVLAKNPDFRSALSFRIASAGPLPPPMSKWDKYPWFQLMDRAESLYQSRNKL